MKACAAVPPVGYTAHDLERWVPEPPKSQARTPFQRDRARVLHSSALRRLGQHAVAGACRGGGVLVERARIVRADQLDRTVGQVADEHGGYTGIQPHHRRTRGVPARGPQPQRVAELMVTGVELGLIGNR